MSHQTPSDRTDAPNSSKRRKLFIHNMEEDDGNAMVRVGEINKSGKGKAALPNSSAGHSNLPNDGSAYDIGMSNNGAVDDYSYNPFHGQDDWVDTYHDDIVYDDHGDLLTHYVHMGIPAGIEVPFPWLPSSHQNNMQIPVNSISTSSISQPKSKSVNLYSSSSSYNLSSTTSHQTGEPAMYSEKEIMSTYLHENGKSPAMWLEPGHGLKKSISSSSEAYLSSQSSGQYWQHKTVNEPFHSIAKSNAMFHASHADINPHDPYPLGAYHGGGYPTLGMPTDALDMGTYAPVSNDLPLNMLQPYMGSYVSMHENLSFPLAQDPASYQSGPTPAVGYQRNVDEILRKFDSFKKFDIVEDCSDHLFFYHCSSSKQVRQPKNWSKRIQEEWEILEKALPDTIFVRVYESRMDLLRAVIIGAEGTPYHDGLFFFDVFFPSSYPHAPPVVLYHSGGLRINPNLYSCGKVCLSLLNTWGGGQKEKWNPGISTMLQVLVSIQGLILNAKPFFNEPGYADMAGSEVGEMQSFHYNEMMFINSLQTMIYSVSRPPKNFEDFVVGYFCKHARDILMACNAYLNGVPVGCFVRGGGVGNAVEGGLTSTPYFRTNLSVLVRTLVNTFSEIGAVACEEFLSLAQIVDESAAAAAASMGRSSTHAIWLLKIDNLAC